MAMRMAITPEDAQKLDKQRQYPMDERAKIDYRLARDQWVAEGCLPEGFNDKEIEILRKMSVLDVRMRSEGLGAEDREALADELQKLLTDAGELRKQALITDGVHSKVMDVICSVLRNSGVVKK